MKLTINKKAMTMGFLVAMVITLVAFILISGTIYRFVSKADDKSVENLCQLSVATRARTTVSLGTENPAELKTAPILCKTLDKKVKPEGSNIEEEKKAVMREFAEKMARCWWMFGEGRYKKDIFAGVSAFGGDKHCFMCYTLMIEDGKYFNEKNPKTSRITAEEFKEFLRQEEHSQLKGVKYLDYFQKSGGPGMVLGIITKEKGIAPHHAYAIAYKAKQNECSWCGYLIAGGATAALTGAVILAIPTGGLSLGAAALVAGGGAAAAYGGYEMAKDKIAQDFFNEVNVNTIYFVDMKEETLGQLFSNSCEKVDDIAGE